tara:strand:+ start:423 stop:620 length:198 start_codon:yes stop_codon:yes gene_type:complete
MSDPETISIIWHVDDVLAQASQRDIKISREKAIDLLHRMDAKHDANIGINWEVIDCYLDMYLKEE